MDEHPLMLLTDGVPERQESALRLPVQWVEDFHHRVGLPELPLSERLKIYKRVCENHWQAEKGHRLSERLSGSLGKFPSFQPLLLTNGVLEEDWSLTPLVLLSPSMALQVGRRALFRGQGVCCGRGRCLLFHLTEAPPPGILDTRNDLSLHSRKEIFKALVLTAVLGRRLQSVTDFF